MERTSRRRYLFFFSASLAVHLVILAGVVAVLLIASDAPLTGPDGPLVVSLNPGDETGGASSPQTPDTGNVRPHTKTPPPEASMTKTPGDADRTGPGTEAPGSGGTPGIAGPAGGGDSSVLADYIRSVRARINRHKRYPPEAAGNGIEGTVTVTFLLAKSGAVLDKEVSVGSGNSSLDEAALAAVGDSSPFPPFPDELSQETLLLRLPINYRQR